MGVRLGTYELTTELAGFAAVTRSITVLAGQEAVTDLQLGLTGVEETVTVTGEAPLLDLTDSSVRGNLDPRQVQELPVNGRNWLDLVMLAPGARGNEVREQPHSLGGTSARGDYQINVDGQQITSNLSSFGPDGQARFGRDAIAEFEFVSNRFDATQSRSSGVQINAITKSGTNTFTGTFAGYFRHDKFNAADAVTDEVLPFQNQQLAWTFGGPIVRDQLHVFGHYEYDRKPQTLVYVTPYESFNDQLTSTDIEHKGGVRVDQQFTPQTRFSFRGLWFDWVSPRSRVQTGQGTVFPASRARSYNRDSKQYLGTLTNVLLDNRAVNEIKGGYSYYLTTSKSIINCPSCPFGVGGPILELQGITIGPEGQVPEEQAQTVWNIRDDFTMPVGRHTLKMGGEFLYSEGNDFRCSNCEGLIDADTGSFEALGIDIEAQFPDILDSTTWDLTPFNPLVSDVEKPFGLGLSIIPRYTTGLWFQDDWRFTERLTLNLGVRYDLEANAFDNKTAALPFMPGDRPNDTNNVSPRFGFAYSANDETVIRGGFGIYFGTIYNPHQLRFHSGGSVVNIVAQPDGRDDFISDPFQGLTFAEAKSRVCTADFANEPGCLRPTLRIYEEKVDLPYSYQPSIGFQRQLGPTMAIEADYVYVGTRKNRGLQTNANLTYDGAACASATPTCHNDFGVLANRSFPQGGRVRLYTANQLYNMHALQTAFTKRFSDGWQLNATYTLSRLTDETIKPLQFMGPGFDYPEVGFPVPEDLGGFNTLSRGDQRHRAVINGVWELPYGFQASGLYFWGSGERQSINYGSRLRGNGSSGNSGEQRLRPDGTFVERNGFIANDIHRVDLRLQNRVPLGPRMGIDLIIEVFNAFNHANFGSYFTRETSSLFLEPDANERLAFAPRMMQLGFRVTF